MSDNDLIRRGDAKGHPFANGMYDREHADRKFISGHECYKEWLDTVPAVPQEMSAVEFFAEYRRMCEYIGRCATCPIMEIAVAPRTPCRYLAYAYPEKAVAIVEKWAREHPERSEDDGEQE